MTYPRKNIFIIVVCGIAAQLALNIFFAFLGELAIIDLQTQSIAKWYALLSYPLGHAIAVMPALAVGWFAARRGALLGALVGAASTLVSSFGFNMPMLFSFVVGTAITSAVSGAAGELMRLKTSSYHHQITKSLEHGTHEF